MNTKKGLLLVFLTSLLITPLFFYYYQETKATDKIAQNLFSALKTGNVVEANRFIINNKELKDILTFLSKNTVTKNKIAKPSLKGLNRAVTQLDITLNDKTHSLEVNLIKNDTGWKINSFSQFKIYPQALITNTSTNKGAQKVDFLSGDKSLTLNAPSGIQASSLIPKEAYFLVGYKDDLIYYEAMEKITLSKVLAISKNTLEGELEGLVYLDSNYLLYDLSKENASFNSNNKVIAGQEKINLYFKEDTITVITMTEPYNPKKVRVVLSTNDFQSLNHDKIVLSSSLGLQIKDKINEQNYNFGVNEKITLVSNQETITVTSSKGKKLNFKNRIHIVPNAQGKIVLHNLSRGHEEKFIPSYRDRLEVASVSNNLIIINELPLEEYLYSVVASEMPQGFGLEALKVQAIAARTYAVAEILKGRFHSYGANLDDSVSSQVFNNVKEQPLSTQAVKITKGLVLYHKDKPIDARFFSTSSGYTANYHEVWSGPTNLNFPGEPVPYLKAKSQLPGQPDLIFYGEEDFRTFITSPNQLAFDRESPFFRWKIEMTGEQLRASIEKNLKVRYSQDPNSILTKTKEGIKSIAIPENPLGELKDLTVKTRGQGGNILELEIKGSKGTYLVRKEYNIRTVLRPQNYVSKEKDVLIKRMDGSVLPNYPLLPSSFFVMDILGSSASEEVRKVTFYGGGNGHGVGMSQWGVRGMLQQRYKLEEIFAHYYPKTTLINLYN